jgi:hypothetical protein
MYCKFQDRADVKMCEEGMSYNYLTGKCEYNQYSGWTAPVDCYDVCKHLKAAPSVLPDGFGECEGVTYYDISKCDNNVDLKANIVTDIVTGAITAGLDTAMNDGSITDKKDICKCFKNDTTNLEKQIVCEASLHIGKQGKCDNDAFLKEMDNYIKSHNITDGQGYDCSLNWCALFVAYNLLQSYKKAGLDTNIIKAVLGNQSNGNVVKKGAYNWAVRYLIENLLKNKVGVQSLVPRVGSIFFRDSYESGQHTGVVVCVDEGSKFWTIEGNVVVNNVKSVSFVEYDWSEIADSKFDESKFPDRPYNISFSKQMRFILMQEQSGNFDNSSCRCDDAEPPTDSEKPPTDNPPLESPKTTCIVKKDCVENNKNRRYAFYTDDGWFVYSGEKGFWKYGKEKWLKLKDADTCEFVEVECKNKCGCEGGGCDCETLQDKLDKQTEK